MFSEINFEVIFVSAYDKYAIKAFEFNAVGYILKPIKADKLADMITQVYEKYKSWW